MRNLVASFALAAAVSGVANAADPDAKAPAPKADVSQLTFGTLRAMPSSDVKAKVGAWLQANGKLDQIKLDGIWNGDKAILEKFLDSVAIAKPELKKVVENARDFTITPPTEVPAVLKDEKDAFVKSNVGAMFARSLSARKVYEEALAATTDLQPEQLIEPSAFYFFKAVAEHSLAGYEKKKKVDAMLSIVRLLDDVVDAPDRYKMVATLMYFDIQNWPKDDKDLGNIGKLMDNSGRRLDLARGGKTTQDIQKKIVFRLDEKIKELENKNKGGS
jgi:hypothetical protein